MILRGAAAVGMEDVAYPGAGGGPAIFPVSPASYDGTCPRATTLLPQPPLCEVHAARSQFDQTTAAGGGDDFAQMRELGFDVVRLVLDWSQLEPAPGHYDSGYVDRVAQVVGWASHQGIYVILDMHQDQYSRFILPATGSTPPGCTPSGGSDGAPAWAVDTGGKPACALDGQSALNPASSAAFDAFWNDRSVPGLPGQSPGTGLQDHYIGALAALATRFSGDPAVLGYEIMNEPQPGSTAALPLADAYQASARDLYPFYRRVIEALTGVRDGLPTCTELGGAASSPPTSSTATAGSTASTPGSSAPAAGPTTAAMAGTCSYPALAHVSRQEIFYEPLAYRNLTDFSIQVSRPFSTYPDLVYAPHIYTHAFTADSFLGYTPADSPYPPDYAFGYRTAEAEAQAMDSAVFVTEFGDNAGSDTTVLAGETAAQDATMTGSTVWAWKGLARTASGCWCVRRLTTSYDTTSDGTPGRGDPSVAPGPDHLIPSRQTYLARVVPRATVGNLRGFGYDPVTRRFWMHAELPSGYRSPGKGDRAHETIIDIPPSVHGRVGAVGDAAVDTVVTRPDGSRVAYVEPGVASAPCPKAISVLCDGYTVTVGSPPLPAVAAELRADLALTPISEVQARSDLESALASAEESTDPAVRSKAGLAAALASVILPSPDPNGP